MGAANKAARQKARELAWLDLARTVMPGIIPDGIVEQLHPPAPDLLIRSDRAVLGIEVTQLFQLDDAALRISVREVEAAQRNILAEAKRLYEASYEHRLFINASFKSGAPPAKKTAARELVELVERHRPETGGMFQVLALEARARALLPEWLQGLTICTQKSDEPSRWIGGSVWSTPSLTQAMLQTAVSRKDKKIDGYLGCCDHVWLLVICDVWPMAASLSIPRNAVEWCLKSRFTRVLLVSREGDGLSF